MNWDQLKEHAMSAHFVPEYNNGCPPKLLTDRLLKECQEIPCAVKLTRLRPEQISNAVSYNMLKTFVIFLSFKFRVYVSESQSEHSSSSTSKGGRSSYRASSRSECHYRPPIGYHIYLRNSELFFCVAWKTICAVKNLKNVYDLVVNYLEP